VDDRDDFELEEEPPAEPTTERVRIIGAQPAGGPAGSEAAGGSGTPGGGTPERRDEGTPPGVEAEAATGSGVGAPPPRSEAGDEAVSAPEMPHWSDPPTGQVPAVLDRRSDEEIEASTWSAAGDTGPAWREPSRAPRDDGPVVVMPPDM
jgi:hypothetical protein